MWCGAGQRRSGDGPTSRVRPVSLRSGPGAGGDGRFRRGVRGGHDLGHEDGRQGRCARRGRAVRRHPAHGPRSGRLRGSPRRSCGPPRRAGHERLRPDGTRTVLSHGRTCWKCVRCPCSRELGPPCRQGTEQGVDVRPARRLRGSQGQARPSPQVTQLEAVKGRGPAGGFVRRGPVHRRPGDRAARRSRRRLGAHRHSHRSGIDAVSTTPRGIGRTPAGNSRGVTHFGPTTATRRAP